MKFWALIMGEKLWANIFFSSGSFYINWKQRSINPEETFTNPYWNLDQKNTNFTYLSLKIIKTMFSLIVVPHLRNIIE